MATDKSTTGPISSAELDDLSIKVAQATSTIRVLAASRENHALTQDALVLVADYLDDVTAALSELHRRHGLTEREAQP